MVSDNKRIEGSVAGNAWRWWENHRPGTTPPKKEISKTAESALARTSSKAPTITRRKTDYKVNKDGSRTKTTKYTEANTGGKAVQSAAQRRTASAKEQRKAIRSQLTSRAAYRGASKEGKYKQARQTATAAGAYKGKYYGPDAFKGDTKVLDAWRASGKKVSPAEFLKLHARNTKRGD